MLCGLQEAPVGFRLPDGTANYDLSERAARRMIRAKLNVVLRQRRRREEILRRQYGRLLPLLNLFRLINVPPQAVSEWSDNGPGTWRRWGFVNGVDFAEVRGVLPSHVHDSRQ